MSAAACPPAAALLLLWLAAVPAAGTAESSASAGEAAESSASAGGTAESSAPGGRGAAARVPAAPVWSRVDGFAGLDEALAVAVDPGTGAVAAGGAGGVWLREPPSPARPSGAARRVLRRGPVRDLAFDSRGALLAATDEGLFWRGPHGRVEDRSPAPGAGARAAHRVRVHDGGVLCATAAGAFHAADGLRFERIRGAPRGDVRALALVEAGGPGLWMAIGGSLWRVAPGPGDPAGADPADAVRVPLPEAGGEVVDLAPLPGPAGGLAILTRRSLGRWRDGRLETGRASLPPGAEARRVVRAGGRLWVATDRGLLGLRGDRLERAEAPAGTTGVHDVVAFGGSVYAAGERGLLRRRAPGRAPSAGAGSDGPRLSASPGGEAPRGPGGRVSEGAWTPSRLRAWIAREPAVQAVHGAALRYLDLRPDRLRALWRGSRRRGWLPELELRGSYGGDRGHSSDLDETFTSGEARLFHDVERDRGRDFGVVAVLSWELGDVLYHGESIDVSREAREIVELRDDVLDEVTQLYFDRRRVLEKLLATPSPPPAEARGLALRAAELAAGLDAWTGGWWSRTAASLPPPSPPARGPDGGSP